MQKLNRGQAEAYPYIKAAVEAQGCAPSLPRDLDTRNQIHWLWSSSRELDLEALEEAGIHPSWMFGGNEYEFDSWGLAPVLADVLKGDAPALVVIDTGHSPGVQESTAVMRRLMEFATRGIPVLFIGGKAQKHIWKMAGDQYKKGWLAPFGECGVDNEATALELKRDYGGEIVMSIVVDEMAP